MRKLLLTILTLLVLLPLLVWHQLPRITGLLAERWLQELGFEQSHLSLHRPDWQSVQIDEFNLLQVSEGRQIQLQARGINVDYSLAQLLQQQRPDAITIDQLHLSIHSDTSISERIEALESLRHLPLELTQLDALFAQIPAGQVQIHRLELEWIPSDSPMLSARGRLRLTPEHLTTWAEIHLDQQAVARTRLIVAADHSVMLGVQNMARERLLQLGLEPLSTDTDHLRLQLGINLESQPLLEWLDTHFDWIDVEQLPTLNAERLAVSGWLQLPNPMPLDASVLMEQITAAGDLRLPDLHLTLDNLPDLQLDLGAHWRWQPGAHPLQGQLQVESRNWPLRARGDFRTNLSGESRFNWQLTPVSLSRELAFLRQLLPTLPPRLQVEGGTLHARGQLQLNDGRWRLQADSRIEAADLIQGESRVRSATITAALELLDTGRLTLSGDFISDQLQVGLPITHTPLRYRYLQPAIGVPQLSLQPLRLYLLGGELHLPGLSFNPLHPELIFLMQVQGIDLNAVLELYAQDGLYGEGQLSGQVPIQVNGSEIHIASGFLTNIKPGVLRYLPPNGINSNVALQLALGALTDLQFSDLDLQVSYQPSGDLHLQARLQGHNPGWQQGRPIDLNLSIHENLLDLLHALQITGRITDALDQRFQR